MTAPDSLVVTAWSALSPYGSRTEQFTAGVRERRVLLPAPGGPVSFAVGGRVPGFDSPRGPGGSGARDRARTAALAGTAVASALERSAPLGSSGLCSGGCSSEARLGFVLGTSTGGTPARPGSGRTRMTGPYVALAGGRISALLGLVRARRMLRAGRASAVVCGAAEESGPARSWLERRAHAEDGADAPARAPLAEGAAVFRVTLAGLLAPSPGREPVAVCATVPGLHARTAVPTRGISPREALGMAVARALDEAGLGAEEVWAVAPSGLDPAEEAVLGGMFAEPVLERLPRAGELFGDAGAAAAALQIALALAHGPGTGPVAGAVPGAGPRHVLVTGVDDGCVAAALLRLGGTLS
ncbi:hypothetical protein ACN20G_31875 (plasmid) [Streptomyces sp. BI20]|uniref:hypothetical protein n=1 Tax=Streptomyces sp. BI20 TaxID=3403460 RepID=UPI003C74AE04